MHYNRWRYYNGTSVTYLSKEPIGQAALLAIGGVARSEIHETPGATGVPFLGAGTNVYVYASHRPANLIDPRGEWVAQAIGLGIGAAVGAATAARSGGDAGDIARSAVVGGLAGVVSTLPIPGLPAVFGGAFAGGIAGFGGNLATQAVVNGTPLACLDLGTAAISGLAGAAGGGIGAGFAAAKMSAALSAAPSKVATGGIFREEAQDAVSSAVGGALGGGLDAMAQ